MSTDDFDRAWPHLEAAVLRANQHTRDTVFNTIKRGNAKLWVLPNSAAVSSIFDYPNGRKAFVAWLAGGELKELQELAGGHAVQFALHNKCDEMRIISGRRGWLRALGWRETNAVAIRDLNHA